MTTSLTKTPIDYGQPALPTCPQWMTSAIGSLMRIEDAGTVTWKLPVHYRLSESELAETRRTLEQINRALAPSRDQVQASIAAVSKLLFTYAIGQATDADARARSGIYLEVTGDLPGWAIHKAVDKWLRHEAGEYNYHWAPAPPEFRVVVLAQMAELRARAAMLERLLHATGGEAPSKTEESKARVRALAEGFVGTKRHHAVPHENEASK